MLFESNSLPSRARSRCGAAGSQTASGHFVWASTNGHGRRRSGAPGSATQIGQHAAKGPESAWAIAGASGAQETDAPASGDEEIPRPSGCRALASDHAENPSGTSRANANEIGAEGGGRASENGCGCGCGGEESPIESAIYKCKRRNIRICHRYTPAHNTQHTPAASSLAIAVASIRAQETMVST